MQNAQMIDNEQEFDLQVEASRTPNPKGQEGDREGQEEGKRASGWQEEDKGRVKDLARTR